MQYWRVANYGKFMKQYFPDFFMEMGSPSIEGLPILGIPIL